MGSDRPINTGGEAGYRVMAPGLTPLEMLEDREIAKMLRDMEGPPYSESQRKQILEALEANRASAGLSKSAMAKMLGVSPSRYSQINTRQYRGAIDPVLQQALLWLRDREEQSSVPADVEYVETSIARMIMAVCSRAVSRPTIGKIIAPSGVGKTMALREFARRRRDRVILLTAGECISTRGSLLREIAEKLFGNVTRAVAADEYYRQIRSYLADAYGGGNAYPICIVVDEATTLHAAAKNMLRNLHDDESCRCAIVLADTARLDVELNGRSTRGQYEQLNSRSRAVWTMTVNDTVSNADVDMVVGSVLATLGQAKKISRPSYQYLRRLAQQDGKLRNVANRLKDVRDLAEKAGCDPTYSVRELDFAGGLSGFEYQMDHGYVPFGRADADASGGSDSRRAASA